MRPVIIIFGAAVRPDGSPSGAMRHRTEAALATARRLTEPLFLPTGGQGRHGGSEAELMAELLAEAGIDRARILIEPTGRNTVRSVLACRRLLGRTAAPVYVATSAYHMPRCVVLLRLAGLRARAGEMPPQAASRHAGKRWYWRLRELAAVPLDAMALILMRRGS